MASLTYNLSGGLPNALRPFVTNAHAALGIPAYWRAVSFLATNLASFGRSVRQNGAKLEERHPLDRLLKRKPNQYQTASQFWTTFFLHSVHNGNGYAVITRTGTTAEIHNLLPDDVTPFRLTDEGAPPWQASQWYFHKPTKQVLPAADILHLPGLGYDGLKGYCPIELCKDTLDHARTVERFAVDFLRKGTIIRGAVEIPAGADEDRQRQIVDTLRAFRAGGDRDVMVLSDGAKLTNVTISPEQAQLIEQGALSTKRICQVTGVPPHFVYEMSESKYVNTAEQAGQDVVRFTFRPWIESIEDELSGKLLSEAELEQGYSVHLNPDALLRGDTATQMQTVSTGVNNGLQTPNEGRELLGLPALNGAGNDELRLPTHLVAPQGGSSNE